MRKKNHNQKKNQVMVSLSRFFFFMGSIWVLLTPLSVALIFIKIMEPNLIITLFILSLGFLSLLPIAKIIMVLENEKER